MSYFRHFLPYHYRWDLMSFWSSMAKVIVVRIGGAQNWAPCWSKVWYFCRHDPTNPCCNFCVDYGPHFVLTCSACHFLKFEIVMQVGSFEDLLDGMGWVLHLEFQRAKKVWRLWPIGIRNSVFKSTSDKFAFLCAELLQPPYPPTMMSTTTTRPALPVTVLTQRWKLLRANLQKWLCSV